MLAQVLATMLNDMHFAILMNLAVFNFLNFPSGLTSCRYIQTRALFRVTYSKHHSSSVIFCTRSSPKTELAPVNPEVSVHPDHIGGLRLAVSTYSGIETKFGLFLPKFQAAPPRPALQQK